MSKITRVELHNIIRNSKKRLDEEKRSHLVTALIEKFICSENVNHLSLVRTTLHSRFFNEYFKKWHHSRRVDGVFRRKNSQ